MSLSKTLLPHLKSLRRHPLRHLSTATPESAAAARLRRHSLLHMPPPLTPSQLRRTPPPRPPKNPDIPTLPEPLPALLLSDPRLRLHNSILTLIRDRDLSEADLLLRHSLYSNSRPAIHTVNAVLSALLRAGDHRSLHALHRFVTQTAVAPNIATHNLLLHSLLACGRPDTALDHYRTLLTTSPLAPSPATYRILVRGLLSNSRPSDAFSVKDDMLSNTLRAPDPTVYNLLMSHSDAEIALSLFHELNGYGVVRDGVVYGSLMRAYFRLDREEEAMQCYMEAVDEASEVVFNAASYNSVLEALSESGKFDYALRLFDRMTEEHRPPVKLAVDLGSLKVMVDGFCANGRFRDAIKVFGGMRDKKCDPDTAAYNNLIGHLGENEMVEAAEDLYREMGEKWVSPDEVTHALLIEACFRVGRIDDAVGYFNKMVKLELTQTAVSYNKVIGGLLKAERYDEAMGFFDHMVENNVRRDITSYEMLLLQFFEQGRLDDALKIYKAMLLDEGVVSRLEMEELMKVSLKKEGREEELGKLFEEVAREKAEALARAAEVKAIAEALALEEAKGIKAQKEAAFKRTSTTLSEFGITKYSRASNEEENASAVTGGALEGTPEQAIQDCGDDQIVVGEENAADFDTLGAE